MFLYCSHNICIIVKYRERSCPRCQPRRNQQGLQPKSQHNSAATPQQRNNTTQRDTTQEHNNTTTATTQQHNTTTQYQQHNIYDNNNNSNNTTAHQQDNTTTQQHKGVTAQQHNTNNVFQFNSVQSVQSIFIVACASLCRSLPISPAPLLILRASRSLLRQVITSFGPITILQPYTSDSGQPT